MPISAIQPRSINGKLSDRDRMSQGVFAVLDCLGFKGAWSRGTDARRIIDFLKQSKARIRQTPIFITIKDAATSNVGIEVAFLSDTAVVAVWKRNSEIELPGGDGFLVLVASALCSHIAVRFLRAPTPFSMRGCITYGQFMIEENFFIGEAVDEAAKFSEISDGAFIWLTPTAMDLYANYRETWNDILKKFLANAPPAAFAEFAKGYRAMLKRAYPSVILPSDLENIEAIRADQQTRWGRAALRVGCEARRSDLVISYQMPRTNGSAIDLGIVSPYINFSSLDPDPLESYYLESFGTAKDISVLSKRQNTLRFLREARKQAESTIEMARRAIRVIEHEDLGQGTLTDQHVDLLLRYSGLEFES
jgi:hypothetical protein